MNAPELLAPAGDFACVIAALDAGADALYFGVDSFNMRSRAQNFSLDDMKRLVEHCHRFDARAYLTLNTIIYENELSALTRVCDRAKTAGVDAVIGWDPAVIRMVNERNMEMHLSTQASVSNSQGILGYYKNYGIRRFVLAREVSLDSLKEIRQNLQDVLGEDAKAIELELFIHGAMCVSLSGRCFLSESVNGESANRGACLQPCRRKYRIMDVEGEYEFELGQDYILSPNDLCTMPFFEKILAARPACVKIEGRMRNPEYVATVTKAYRRAIDAWMEHNDGSSEYRMPPDYEGLKAELTEELRTVFNRGFHAGYYMGKPLDEWTRAPDNQATYRKESVGRVENYYSKLHVAEILVQSAAFSQGDQLVIQGQATGNIFAVVNELRVHDRIVNRAQKGDRATIKVPGKVRRGDVVFRRYK